MRTIRKSGRDLSPNIKAVSLERYTCCCIAFTSIGRRFVTHSAVNFSSALHFLPPLFISNGDVPFHNWSCCSARLNAGACELSLAELEMKLSWRVGSAASHRPLKRFQKREEQWKHAPPAVAFFTLHLPAPADTQMLGFALGDWMFYRPPRETEQLWMWHMTTTHQIKLHWKAIYLIWLRFWAHDQLSLTHDKYDRTSPVWLRGMTEGRLFRSTSPPLWKTNPSYSRLFFLLHSAFSFPWCPSPPPPNWGVPL